MKKFCYLAIMLLLTSAILLFYLKRPDGQPWLTVDGIATQTSEASKQMVSLSQAALAEAINTTTQQATKLTTELKGDQGTRVYKWQDAQGQWHFSDKPNPNGNSEQVVLNPNDITVIEAETLPVDTINNSKPSSTNKSLPNVYNPKRVEQLFNDAQNIEKTLEQRNKQLEKID